MKMISGYILVIILITGNLCAQPLPDNVIHLDSLPKDGILLDKGWKFYPGDNPDFAKPEFDDTNWESLDPTRDMFHLPRLYATPIGWLRIHFYVDSSLLYKPLAFKVYQSIASQVYQNGKLLAQYGVIGDTLKRTIAYRPDFDPGGLLFTQQDQFIAVRFAAEPGLSLYELAHPYYAFRFRVLDVSNSRRFEEIPDKYPLENALYVGIFLTIASIHLGIFLRYRKRKADLFFSLAMFAVCISNYLFLMLGRGGLQLNTLSYFTLLDMLLYFPTYNLFLYLAITHIFPMKVKMVYWTVLAILFAQIIFLLMTPNAAERPWWLELCILFAVVFSIILSWREYLIGRKGGVIIFLGFFVYLAINIFLRLIWNGVLTDSSPWILDGFPIRKFLWFAQTVSIPFCLSLYLALDFVLTSRALEHKLQEVQYLSVKTISQEKEKQEMLAQQNELLEQQVKERTLALSRSLDELKSTQTQLIHSEKMASLGELTAGIAHEIQNPLNFVNNFSDVNQELILELKDEISRGNMQEVEKIADSIRENEGKINHHGKRADAIVKNMLQHSRSSNGQMEPTDINALCDEYLRLSYHGLRAKDKHFNATLETDYGLSVGKVKVIPQDIGRVLLNLFNNAFYAVADKKKKAESDFHPMVSVSTRRVDGKVQIIVGDNGSGIPEKLQEKIFQPFFTTKPTGLGTGLGLSLSYDIIKAHGGEILVKSSPGESTVFTINLPDGNKI